MLAFSTYSRIREKIAKNKKSSLMELPLSQKFQCFQFINFYLASSLVLSQHLVAYQHRLILSADMACLAHGPLWETYIDAMSTKIQTF